MDIPVVETVEDEEGEQANFRDDIKKDCWDSRHEEAIMNGATLPTIDTSELVGRTFISNPDEEGNQVRAKVEDIEPLEDWTADRTEQLFRFRCKHGEKIFEELLT